MSSVYYRHSGRFSPLAPLVLLVGAALPAAVGGWLYGLADLWCPIIYLNFLMTLALGFGVGWLTLQLAKAARLRNASLAGLIGLLAGSVGLYAAWCGWLSGMLVRLFDRTWADAVWQPDRVLHGIQLFGEHGAWSVGSGSDPVSGLPLYGVWVMEAMIVVGAAAVVPYRELGKLAYCEPCGRWLSSRTVVGPFTKVADPKAIRTRLETGEFAVLGDLRPADDAADEFTQIDLWRCDGCDAMHLMTLRAVQMKPGKDGKLQRVDREVVRHLVIDRESRDLIASLGEAREAGVAPAPTPPPAPAT